MIDYMECKTINIKLKKHDAAHLSAQISFETHNRKKCKNYKAPNNNTIVAFTNCKM